MPDRDIEDIEAIFKEAWLKKERFYFPQWSSQEWIRPMLHFMQELREKGYHKKLRAGTSLYRLILSRSERHGLRRDQARIIFAPNRNEDGGMTVLFRVGDDLQQFSQDKIEVTPEIETLLNRLVNQPID